MDRYDLVVVGGGPAGSAAAWRAATSGARVVVVDKATFPRDKPCGDGLTPRAVRAISELGLEAELKAFNRIDGMRVFGGGRTLIFDWPTTDEFPNHGYVVARTELDELLLRHAERAGAEVREGEAVKAPIVEAGCVRGVVTTRGELRAPVVVAADGASSRVARGVGMTRTGGVLGVAVRAHFPADRPAADDTLIDSYLELWDGDDLLPGYGWVFPMGNGRINVGVGLLSTYSGWRQVNTAHLMGALLRTVPAAWGVPSIDDLREAGDLKGWRLPMGFAVWPPWRPGVLAVGDAAGVVNPFNGEGISEAVESGVIAAEVGIESLDGRGPRDLRDYERRLDELWGPYYRLGRTFARLIGKPAVMRTATFAGMRYPPIMAFTFKVLANLYRSSGGGPGDATMRALVRLASKVKT